MKYFFKDHGYLFVMEEVKNTGRVVDISMINLANGERMWSKIIVGTIEHGHPLKLHCTYHRNWGSRFNAKIGLISDFCSSRSLTMSVQGKSSKHSVLGEKCRGNVRRKHFVVFYFVTSTCADPSVAAVLWYAPNLQPPGHLQTPHLSLGDFKRLRLLKTL